VSDVPNPAFGDWDPDDSFDPSEGPDALQVAIKLHKLRKAALDDLSQRERRRLRRREDDDWRDLDDADRDFEVEIIRRLIEWGRRQGTWR